MGKGEMEDKSVKACFSIRLSMRSLDRYVPATCEKPVKCGDQFGRTGKRHAQTVAARPDDRAGRGNRAPSEFKDRARRDHFVWSFAEFRIYSRFHV